MPTPITYGSDWLIFFPIDYYDSADHVDDIADLTIAADDVALLLQGAAPTTPTAKILGFDSMSELPEPGDQLDENGGDGVAVVMFVVIVSGSIGGGDAAGFIFVKSVTGTWTDNAQIDINGGNTNVATVDAGTTDEYTLSGNQIANTAGLWAFAEGLAYIALTAAETQCKRGFVRLINQEAPKEFKDDGELFHTIGDSDAQYPPDGGSGVAHVGEVTAVTDAVTFRASAIPSQADDDWNHHLIEVVDASGTQRDSDWIDDFDHSDKEFVLENGLKFTPQVGDQVRIYVHRRDTEPAKLAGSDSVAATAVLEAIQSAAERSVPTKAAAFTFPFQMVDETDHVTPEESLTVTATVSKDGGAFGSPAGSVSEIGNGWYEFAATAADMTANRLIFYFTASGADPVSVPIITDGGV